MTPQWPAKRLTCPGTLLSAPSLGDLASNTQTPDEPAASLCPAAAPVPLTAPSPAHRIAWQQDWSTLQWEKTPETKQSSRQSSCQTVQYLRDHTSFFHPVASLFFSAELRVQRKQSPAVYCSPPSDGPIPPDPVQEPTHILPHGAELLPSTRNITAILPMTIHLCLN